MTWKSLNVRKEEEQIRERCSEGLKAQWYTPIPISIESIMDICEALSIRNGPGSSKELLYRSLQGFRGIKESKKKIEEVLKLLSLARQQQ